MALFFGMGAIMVEWCFLKRMLSSREKGTFRSVPARKSILTRGATAVDRVDGPLFQTIPTPGAETLA
jgi:hypothetical protein